MQFRKVLRSSIATDIYNRIKFSYLFVGWTRPDKLSLCWK